MNEKKEIDLNELEKYVNSPDGDSPEKEARIKEIYKKQVEVGTKFLNSITKRVKKEIAENKTTIIKVKDLKEFISKFDDDADVMFYNEEESEFYGDDMKLLLASSYFDGTCITFMNGKLNQNDFS